MWITICRSEVDCIGFINVSGNRNAYKMGDVGMTLCVHTVVEWLVAASTN